MVDQCSNVSGNLSVLILTRNESVHIARAISSARRLTKHIYVIDSNSTDGTKDIAIKADAQVFSVSHERFSDKLNWAASSIKFETPWVLRLDADEILTDDLVSDLPRFLSSLGIEVTGVYIRRQLWFMGHWVKYGGMYPTLSMRLWRRGLASCESRDLDEHMILKEGIAATAQLDIIDNPLFDLSSWIDKHNRYATLEARAAVEFNGKPTSLIKPSLFGTLPQKVRWIKVNIFYRLPLFVRPFLYFLYRYFIRFGFLDGKTGFVFHFMHGLWYRLLVDAKIFEMKSASKEK
jgi:glycosyltransferase involved in cell wall biosynthesis